MNRSFAVTEVDGGRFDVGTPERPDAFNVGTLGDALNLVSFLLDWGQPISSGGTEGRGVLAAALMGASKAPNKHEGN